MSLLPPMLACSDNVTREDAQALTYPKWITKKLDGIRCRIVRTGKHTYARSRTNIEIPNIHVWEWAQHMPEGLDGELLLPNSSYNETQSRLMTRITMPFTFEYHVFDLWNAPLALYLKRLQRLQTMWAKVRLHSHNVEVKLLAPVKVSSPSELLRAFDAAISDGHEGLIIRDNSVYKHGRATWTSQQMLKMKAFADSEAIIIGFEEAQENLNPKTENAFGYAKRSSHRHNKRGKGILGAFICRDPNTGVVFNVGSGFSQRDAKKFWACRQQLLNSVLCYKHHITGAKEAPRSPIYKGLRYD